jgi:hypothetical protein
MLGEKSNPIMKEIKMKLLCPLFGILLILSLLPAACNTAVPKPSAAPSIPTITFDNDTCSYAGPQPFPAGISTTVNWVIKNKDRSKYGLYVFTLDSGKTEKDLMAAANDPTPPAWSHIVGSEESAPNNSLQVSVNATKGPLYFSCWFSPPDIMFQVIGPIAVASTNP